MPFRAHGRTMISPIVFAHLLIRVVFRFVAIRNGNNAYSLLVERVPISSIVDLHILSSS
jgi:hypothetical protein